MPSKSAKQARFMQAAEGFELFQAVFKTTYRWVLIFKASI